MKSKRKKKNKYSELIKIKNKTEKLNTLLEQ